MTSSSPPPPALPRCAAAAAAGCGSLVDRLYKLLRAALGQLPDIGPLLQHAGQGVPDTLPSRRDSHQKVFTAKLIQRPQLPLYALAAGAERLLIAPSGVCDAQRHCAATHIMITLCTASCKLRHAHATTTRQLSSMEFNSERSHELPSCPAGK